MIYLDYQATTPLAPEALAAMRPLLEEGFGNPHSPHRMGRAAKAAVEVARDQVAAPFGPGGRLLFTSGATEALNWAIKGIAETSPRRRIVTTAIEHAAVLDTVAWLGGRGHDVIVLPVDHEGIVDLDAARAAIDGDTALVAAMLVNNEIGTIQPVAALGAMAREAGATMICDAVQGYGRVPLPVDACDLIAISAHKIHGPKGIGALWLRDGFEPAPLMHGGGQEGGLRSGTLAPALCAGFGAAAKLAFERIETDADHVFGLFGRAHSMLGGWIVNGALDRRYFGNLNIRHDGLDVSRLMADVRDVAFSAGSACASGSGRPSHVLEAIGLAAAEARSSIRLGFGRYTTGEEIDTAIALILDAADRQRAFA
ncbi:cysteine desulfurase [Sphingomonas sp. CGMCC 1.13654]|uniref:Cysteine desulfurase n=1 Tax=Sphingomonas chungangi TaxID=2683589 RepID=A0A838LCH3_9SPHN|nr:cysteine desulfurase family protein [Sphingomonas chungangi]MBA2936339.1 cysteine desulfurase [Sphingomonas chungangi]MVW55724.1 aminotransferase class V-fold PLP-dependent enzyme [Sphingomonas chungangi]